MPRISRNRWSDRLRLDHTPGVPAGTMSSGIEHAVRAAGPVFDLPRTPGMVVAFLRARPGRLA